MIQPTSLEQAPCSTVDFSVLQNLYTTGNTVEDVTERYPTNVGSPMDYETEDFGESRMDLKKMTNIFTFISKFIPYYLKM